MKIPGVIISNFPKITDKINSLKQKISNILSEWPLKSNSHHKSFFLFKFLIAQFMMQTIAILISSRHIMQCHPI